MANCPSRRIARTGARHCANAPWSRLGQERNGQHLPTLRLRIERETDAEIGTRKASLLDVISGIASSRGAVETHDKIIEEGVEQSQLFGKCATAAFADTRRLRYASRVTAAMPCSSDRRPATSSNCRGPLRAAFFLMGRLSYLINIPSGGFCQSAFLGGDCGAEGRRRSLAAPKSRKRKEWQGIARPGRALYQSRGGT